MGKRVSTIDKHVGARLRLRRNMIGVSQEVLGGKLGISFQQVQKYESGLNRISAGRLQTIAQIMDVPVAYFFESAPSGQKKLKSIPETVSTSTVDEFLTSSHGLELAVAYMRIRDSRVRRSIVRLVEQLSQRPNLGR